MSYRTSSHASSLRQSGHMSASTSQATLLQQRIHEKRLELENLKQLRDLSAELAGQMEQLESRMSTLSDGTEGMYCLHLIWVFVECLRLVLMMLAIAAVMSNWHNVLQAIAMASAKIPVPNATDGQDMALPQTLIRIPVQDLATTQAPEGPSDA